MSEILNGAIQVLSVVTVEALLSVDNSLIMATQVSHLPQHQRKHAMRYGMIGAYVLRLIALYFAQLVLTYSWVRLVGAAYLIDLMLKNLLAGDEEHKLGSREAPFWSTVGAILLTDLAFSLDNVVAAVAISKSMLIVSLGVLAGMLALWLLSGMFARLIEKRPVLKRAAYVLVGYVGAHLAAEELLGWHAPDWVKPVAMVGIIVASLGYERFKRKP